MCSRGKRKIKKIADGRGSGLSNAELIMRESAYISILNRVLHILLWACLSIVVFLPQSILYSQDYDDDDEVEEYFGGDEEYEDDYEDEYLDDDYEEDTDYDDYDDYEEDEESLNAEEAYEEELIDEAENLGYTIDIALGSPRYVNPALTAWNSNVDLRASVEFPLLMQLLGARFRFGFEVGSFKFENAKFNQIGDTVVDIGETFSGVTAMGIVAFPAGPGKIKFGIGLVGASPGFTMEASYGVRIGGIVELRGGIRSTEAMNAKTGSSLELGRAGWMDGQIVLGVNL